MVVLYEPWKELKDLHEDSMGHVEPRYPSYQCKYTIETLTYMYGNIKVWL